MRRIDAVGCATLALTSSCHAGAIKFLRPIVDIAKRPCDQDYENIMEGIKDIARDLDDVLKMDEKSVTDNK